MSFISLLILKKPVLTYKTETMKCTIIIFRPKVRNNVGKLQAIKHGVLRAIVRCVYLHVEWLSALNNGKKTRMECKLMRPNAFKKAF